MEIERDRESKVLRQRVGSIMLVIWMATATSALRIALWAANVITLWYLYGRTTVEHEHLRITKIKPQLVVSNGDVLRGIGGYHFLVGVAIWLPLTCGLLFLIYYALLPGSFRRSGRGDHRRDKASVLSLCSGHWLCFSWFRAYWPQLQHWRSRP